MRFILDIIIILIMAISIWQGFRHGVIKSLLSLTTIIVALIFANLIATSVSRQIVPAMEPFVNGYVDSDTVSKTVIDKLGYGDSDKSLNDIISEDGSLKYDYAYLTMRETGFFKDASEDLATDAVNYAEKNNVSMTDAVITVICNSAAYVLCITVAFTIIMVILTAVIEMMNIDIRLTNAEAIDRFAGGAIGFFKGFLICILICWLLGFMGLLIGKTTSDKGLMSFFLAFRLITRTLI